MTEYQRFFKIYSLFHDPPGTPKNLKCVGCKVASAGVTLALAGASLYGVKRTIINNAYVGMGYAVLSVGFLATSSLLGRLAYDNNNYNQLLIRETQEAIRKERLKLKQQNAKDTK